MTDELNTLSEEVNTSSTIKTGTQCKDKWPNLLTAYKKAKVSSTKTGNGTEKMKAFKHFDQMDKFMSDKHEIVMLFLRNSSNSSSQISAAVEDSALSSQEHFIVQAQETEGPTESLPIKDKGGKVKSPRKGKGKQKVGEDDRCYDLLEKQTKILEASQKGQEQYFKFLKESEDGGRDLLISAIRELDTVLDGKRGTRRKAASSEEEE